MRVGAPRTQGKYEFAIPIGESKTYGFRELRGSLGGYPPMSFGGRGI